MIKVQISGSGKLEDGTVKPMVADIVGVAKLMAEQLKETAFADTRKATFDTRKPSTLSDEYMRLLGSRFGSKAGWQGYADESANSARPNLRLVGKSWIWANSNLWHKIARKDDFTFNRTGGMWAGLRVRNFGAKGAIIEFSGKSEGQSGEWKASRGRTKEGQAKKEKWNSKVSNNLKAWTVFKNRKVLLIEPDDKTQKAFEIAVNEFVNQWAADQIGAKTRGIGAGGSLSARFLDALK